jgi:hypothetical protein
MARKVRLRYVLFSPSAGHSIPLLITLKLHFQATYKICTIHYLDIVFSLSISGKITCIQLEVLSLLNCVYKRKVPEYLTAKVSTLQRSNLKTGLGLGRLPKVCVFFRFIFLPQQCQHWQLINITQGVSVICTVTFPETGLLISASGSMDTKISKVGL